MLASYRQVCLCCSQQLAFTRCTNVTCDLQATAAHAEADGLADAGRHNEAEAAAAAAQRWLRRAAQAAQ